jgi:hypothetical protein
MSPLPIISAAINPIRAYLYVALLVGAVGLFGWYTLHERDIEHAKDVAVAAKAVAKVTKKDKTTEVEANAEVQNDIVIFKQAVAAPPPGDIGLVCESSGSHPVPITPLPDGIGPPPPSGQPIPANVFDPSGDLLAVARSSQARIRELLAENASLRAEMTAAAKAHQ